MKKILIAFEGTHYSAGAMEFARVLNELEPLLLTGVFLPQSQLSNLWSYAGAAQGAAYIPLLESEESEAVEQNIERFEKFCKGNNIDYRIHKEFFDFVLPELKKESRFADLLILGSEVFYENLDNSLSNEYIKDALEDMECPVLVVPEKYNFPQHIVLAYDGSKESVYAIRQFAYLFPELTSRETILVYANKEADKDFPDKLRIEELAARHFKNLILTKLDLNPKKYFTTWLSEKKDPILVCGSYSRSGFSQLFKQSFVRDIIAEHKLPVFVAHSN